MSQAITIIVDDQDENINYLCPVVKQTVAGTYINNTWTAVENAECGSGGWFKYTFSGTRIQVAAAFSSPNRNFSVSIDDGPKYRYTGDGFYESPILPDGQHILTYYAPRKSSGLSATLDYLTVSAGENTPIFGKNLIVDDADGVIHYSGNWATEAPIPLSFDFATSLYESTTHWSSSIGDTFEFKFKGNSIAVYGIIANLAESPQNNITTTYIIDGVGTEQGVPFGTLEGLPKARLFETKNLTSDSHTLLVNISDITASQVIGFDFIVYTSTAAGVSIAAGVNPSDESLSPAQSRTGVIAGSIIGTLLLLSIFIYAVMRWQKRKKYGRDK